MSEKKSATYNTKQGNLILECFKKNKGIHLTIDDILSYLKQNNTPVGVTTVYRHLQKLSESGIITKYNVDLDSGACYQYTERDCKMHFHLKCTKCNELFHSECSYLQTVQDHIFSHHGFTVDNTRTVFYGLCQNCLRSTKKGSKNEK